MTWLLLRLSLPLPRPQRYVQIAIWPEVDVTAIVIRGIVNLIKWDHFQIGSAAKRLEADRLNLETRLVR